jgi:hypothetical protein
MDMRFDTWNVWCLCRSGSIVTVSEGRAVVPNQQENTNFSVDKGMRNIN